MTRPAGRQRWSRAGMAVERLGQDSRGGSLASSPWPNKQVGVRKPVLQNRVFQRLRDMLLPDDIVKRLGAVFPGKDRVAHPATMRALGRVCQRRESFCCFTVTPPAGYSGQKPLHGIRHLRRSLRAHRLRVDLPHGLAHFFYTEL